MTLIIGLNLSNKLYLAGDTRVTSTKVGDSKKIYIENILKLAMLWGDNIYPQRVYDGNSIAVGVAGDVEFASFLVARIKTNLNNGKLSSDIRVFSNEVEVTIKDLVNEWLVTKEYRHCCLMFSGMVKHRSKLIEKEKLEELVRVYNNKVATEAESREKHIKEALLKDQTLIMLNEKLKREAGRGIEEMLKEGDTPEIPKYIQEAIAEGRDYIDAPDSFLVGFDIDPQTRRLEKETAEWGEFLSYGVQLAKAQITQDLVAFLELSGNKEPKHSPHLLESSVITTEILAFAKRQNIMSIGGTAILFQLDKQSMLQIIGKDLVFTPDRTPAIKLYGKVVPLMSFQELSKVRQRDKMEA